MGITNFEAKSFSTICHILKHCPNATSKGRGRKGTLAPRKPTKRKLTQRAKVWNLRTIFRVLGKGILHRNTIWLITV